MDCLETATCWSMLHDPSIAGDLDAEAFLELAVKAGYGEDQAQRAATQRALARMRKDLPP